MLLNVRKLALLTGFSENHLRLLIRQKRIPAQRVGIQYLIEDDLVDKIKKMRIRLRIGINLLKTG